MESLSNETSNFESGLTQVAPPEPRSSWRDSLSMEHGGKIVTEGLGAARTFAGAVHLFIPRTMFGEVLSYLYHI